MHSASRIIIRAVSRTALVTLLLVLATTAKNWTFGTSHALGPAAAVACAILAKNKFASSIASPERLAILNLAALSKLLERASHAINLRFASIEASAVADAEATAAAATVAMQSYRTVHSRLENLPCPSALKGVAGAGRAVAEKSVRPARW